MKWFIKCLKNYATFKGRARRTEFWMFTLFYTIILFVFGLLSGLTEPEPYYSEFTYMRETAGPSLLSAFFSTLATIFFIGTFLPTLAVSVRRLHDTGKTGWWVLINLIPYIGGIVLLVFLVSDSDEQENQYGPNPKAME